MIGDSGKWLRRSLFAVAVVSSLSLLGAASSATRQANTAGPLAFKKGGSLRDACLRVANAAHCPMIFVWSSREATGLLSEDVTVDANTSLEDALKLMVSKTKDASGSVENGIAFVLVKDKEEVGGFLKVVNSDYKFKGKLKDVFLSEKSLFSDVPLLPAEGQVPTADVDIDMKGKFTLKDLLVRLAHDTDCSFLIVDAGWTETTLITGKKEKVLIESIVIFKNDWTFDTKGK